MDSFYFFLLIFCVVAYIFYLDMLTEENINTAQKLSNVIQQSNGAIVDSKWIVYIAQKRKNLVAGALSLSSTIVLGIAKVYIFSLN